MAWTLRATDTVPLANREAYEQKIRELIGGLPAKCQHKGSYRVAFGKSLEYMHLIEFASLSDYENEPYATWKPVVDAYESGLATDSHWEWLRILQQP